MDSPCLRISSVRNRSRFHSIGGLGGLIRSLLQKLLHMWGYSTLVASDGKESLAGCGKTLFRRQNWAFIYLTHRKFGCRLVLWVSQLQNSSRHRCWKPSGSFPIRRRVHVTLRSGGGRMALSAPSAAANSIPIYPPDFYGSA